MDIAGVVSEESSRTGSQSPWTRGRKRWSALCLGALTCWGSATGAAHAAPSATDDEDALARARTALLAAGDGLALPNSMAARMEPGQRASAVALGGYDAASRTALARFVGDVNIVGPLDLRLGLTYLPNLGSSENHFEPQFGLRLRLLSQVSAGIDLAAAVLYRRDRYTQDDGLVQAVVAIGRRWGRVAVLGNVAYGSDLEGDDRDGELGLAMLYQLAPTCQLGLESHARFDLASDDPRRHLRGQGPFDVQAGPVFHYALGPAILTAEAGVSSYRFEHTRAGLYALAGLGGVY